IGLLLGMMAAMALAACDLGAGGGTATGTPSASPQASATTGGTSGPGATMGMAALKHEPSGTADLTWSQSDQSLQVQMALTGLAPNSTHAAHIHTGSCAQQGAAIHGLQDIKADGQGKATLNQTITNVEGGIPSSGWYLNVHN